MEQDNSNTDQLPDETSSSGGVARARNVNGSTHDPTREFDTTQDFGMVQNVSGSTHDPTREFDTGMVENVSGSTHDPTKRTTPKT